MSAHLEKKINLSCDACGDYSLAQGSTIWAKKLLFVVLSGEYFVWDRFLLFSSHCCVFDSWSTFRLLVSFATLHLLSRTFDRNSVSRSLSLLVCPHCREEFGPRTLRSGLPRINHLSPGHFFKVDAVRPKCDENLNPAQPNAILTYDILSKTNFIQVFRRPGRTTNVSLSINLWEIRMALIL